MDIFGGHANPLQFSNILVKHLGQAARAARGEKGSPSTRASATPPGPSQQLANAAKSGDAAKVESILQTGVKLKHEFDPSGGKLLMLACKAGHADVVACLLAHGIGADARGDEQKRTYAIHIAANRGDLAMLAVLLNSGADVNVADDEGNTPAHMVAAAANEICLVWLQNKGADTSARNNMGLTPFQLAASLHGDTIFAGKVLSLRDSLTAPAAASGGSGGDRPTSATAKHSFSSASTPDASVQGPPPPTDTPPTMPALPAAETGPPTGDPGASLPKVAAFSAPVQADAGAASAASAASSSSAPRRSGRLGVGAYPPAISLSLRRGASSGSAGSGSGRALISPHLGTSPMDLGAALTPQVSTPRSDTPSAAAAAAAAEDAAPTHYGIMPIVSARSVQDRDEDGEDEQLGRGGFAAVYGATCSEFEGQPLAYKKWDMAVTELGARREEQVINTLEYMRQKHMERRGGDEGAFRHIVRSVAWVRTRQGFQGLLMERAQCSLADFYMRDIFSSGQPLQECVSLSLRLQWACQITLAITQLHSCNVLHRDLKPANCLLRDDYEMAVSDFGESRAMGVHTAARSNHTLLLTAPGAKTATHIPPESMEQDGHNGTWGRSSDVWQLGLTLYTVFTGRAPWDSASIAEGLQAATASGKDVNTAWREVLNWVYLSPDREEFEASVGPWPPCVPQELRRLVLDCLQTETRGATPRPPASGVLLVLKKQQAQMGARGAGI